MKVERDAQLPFDERMLRDIANSVSETLEFLRGQRGEIERSRGPAHERVRAVNRAVDRLERAVHMLCNRGLHALREKMGHASKYFSDRS